MWVCASAFQRGLYAEHHDELAFLYRQIGRHRDEGTLPRERLAEFEWRLVAHLDGLNLGGALAWREIGARHDDEDAGHWYAAGLLACAQREHSRFAALLQRAGRDASAPAAPALSDALRHAMPADWDGHLLGWLAEAPQPLFDGLADVASFRGGAWRDVLERRLSAGVLPSVELLRALGRSGAVASAPWLIGHAQAAGDDATLRNAALLALAEMGAPQALPLVRRAAEESSAVHALLGLMGGRQDARVLLHGLAAAPASQTAFGLGLLGELSAVRPLVAALEDERIGSSAATALQWITGAELMETVFEAGEDEGQAASGANDRETDRQTYARLRPGAALAPRAAAGQSGEVVQRISRDPARWTQWLAEAAPQFRAGRRYRFGREYSARWLLQTLADESNAIAYRRYASDELSIRHAAPHRLDPRASVGRQRATLLQLDAWAAALGEPQARDSWVLAGVAV